MYFAQGYIKHSSRDYKKADTWGKNQFNSSFPAALACYLHSKGMNAVYIKADNALNRKIECISMEDVFGINPLSDDIYFSFYW